MGRRNFRGSHSFQGERSGYQSSVTKFKGGGEILTTNGGWGVGGGHESTKEPHGGSVDADKV